MEVLNYNLLFRWFDGLSPDDPVWLFVIRMLETGKIARESGAEAVWTGVQLESVISGERYGLAELREATTSATRNMI